MWGWWVGSELGGDRLDAGYGAGGKEDPAPTLQLLEARTLADGVTFSQLSTTFRLSVYPQRSKSIFADSFTDQSLHWL